MMDVRTDKINVGGLFWLIIKSISESLMACGQRLSMAWDPFVSIDMVVENLK